MGTIRNDVDYGTHICENCGKEYKKPTGNSKYCSAACREQKMKEVREEWNKKAAELKKHIEEGWQNCLNCGKEFKPTRNWQLYCCTKCCNDYQDQKKKNKNIIKVERYKPRKKDGFSWAEILDVMGRYDITSYPKAIEILKAERR